MPLQKSLNFNIFSDLKKIFFNFFLNLLVKAMSSLKRFALLQMTILNAFFNLAVSTVFVIPLHIHYSPQQTNIKLFQFNYLTTHNTTMPSISLCCFSPYQICHKQFPIPLLRCQQNATPSFHYATIEFCFCCWFFFDFTGFCCWLALPIFPNAILLELVCL